MSLQNKKTKLRQILRKLISKVLEERLNRTFVRLDKNILRLSKKLINYKIIALNYHEIQILFQLIGLINNIKGDIAELGVYRGGSAKVICEARTKNKTLHLFDTFDGMPTPSEIDNDIFYKGSFTTNLTTVKKLLKRHKQIKYHIGVFPETAKEVGKIKFSFVHLDADIYESTKSGLEFFWPKINKGGIVLIHDYPCALGVKKAVEEFFQDKPEYIIRISHHQALIVKFL